MSFSIKKLPFAESSCIALFGEPQMHLKDLYRSLWVQITDEEVKKLLQSSLKTKKKTGKKKSGKKKEN